jgi:dTDP-4-amino-4,6-dideoxygalactose transaminase
MVESKQILAIDGGAPVRSVPLPEESPGIHYFGTEEQESVLEVLRNRSPFRFYGPDLSNKCLDLEELVCRKYDVRHSIAINSGTSGIYIGLAAMGVGPGDEVLLPGYLWTSCINAIVTLGAIPRLVDIDDTFTMSPADLERKISPQSKAVLYINMSGVPGRIDKIVEIAHANNLTVLEDNCQAFGGSFKGKATGTLGDIGVVSFQINKIITSGEGGLITCNDDHLFNRCFGIHDLGYARDDYGILMDTSCEEKYHMWGTGSRMSELQGAVLLAQIRKIDDIISSMRNSKYKVREGISDIDGLTLRTIIDPAGDTGSFLIASLPTREICQKFVDSLRAEGIKSKGYAKPCISFKEWGLHLYYNNKSLVNRRSLYSSGWPWTSSENEFSKNHNYEKGELPVCDDLFERSLLLKVSSALTDRDQDDIISAFRKVASVLL